VTKPSTHRPLGDTSKIIAGVYNRKGIEFCWVDLHLFHFVLYLLRWSFHLKCF
jgi:hypothetical protein